MTLSVAEQLTYSTVRIEALDKNMNPVGTGTGFIFDLEEDNPKISRPIVITNKHVVQNASFFRILLCTADKTGTVLDTVHYPILFSVEHLKWTMHPEVDVDLCAIPLSPFVVTARQQGVELFYRCIDFSIIPDDAKLDEFDAVEAITMIGYPIGLWDSVNNKPIHRRGVTATHFAKDYCGKKEFLIECTYYSTGSCSFFHTF